MEEKDLSKYVASNVGTRMTFNAKAKKELRDMWAAEVKPWLKQLLFNSINSFAGRMILNGKPSTTSTTNQYWKGISGNTLSDIAKGIAQTTTVPSAPKLNLADNIEIPVEDWSSGNRLIDEINEYLNEYGSITVPKLFVQLRQPIDTNNSQLGNYGWTCMKEAQVKHTWDGGYVLCLPKVKPLEK